MVAVQFSVWMVPWRLLPFVFSTFDLSWLIGFRSFLVLIFAFQAAGSPTSDGGVRNVAQRAVRPLVDAAGHLFLRQHRFGLERGSAQSIRSVVLTSVLPDTLKDHAKGSSIVNTMLWRLARPVASFSKILMFKQRDARWRGRHSVSSAAPGKGIDRNARRCRLPSGKKDGLPLLSHSSTARCLKALSNFLRVFLD